MKVGIKRVSESEWLVHVGCAWLRLGRFSLELLNLSLENAITQNSSAHLIQSYIQLGLKMNELDDKGMQLLLRTVDPKDIVVLLQVSNDAEFVKRVLKNLGVLLAKQIEQDLQQNEMPSEEAIKASIRRIAERMFEMEQRGEIEFFNENTQYI
ncbi:FliG C-terminal domain-containing protein [Galenea microaerophila]